MNYCFDIKVEDWPSQITNHLLCLGSAVNRTSRLIVCLVLRKSSCIPNGTGVLLTEIQPKGETLTALQTKPETEHVERDPAKIPAPFLTHAQIRDLQAEVLKLRLKRRNQREAIANLNRAMERKSYLLLRSNADRSVLNDDFESLRERYNQVRRGTK